MAEGKGFIDTVIFDIGNVLAAFSWSSYLETFGYEPAVYDRVAKAVFLSAAWHDFDRSLMSDDEVLEAFISNDPEMETQIREVFARVGRTVVPYSYSESWIKGLKQAGYRVYVLSNFAEKTFRQVEHELSFLKETDGVVVSFEEKRIKPEPEIYQILLDRYQVTPKKSVFLDDLEVNIEAARQLGIHGIRFESLDQARAELETLGVRFCL